MEINRREVNLGLLAFLAAAALRSNFVSGETERAEASEKPQLPPSGPRYPGEEAAYSRISEVWERFAKGDETNRDMANYYVCKFNIYTNRAFREGKNEKLARKGSNAMEAIGKYSLRGIVCT